MDQIINCLSQIISENKPYNLRLCTFTLYKFQENNLCKKIGLQEAQAQMEGQYQG